MSKKLDEFKHTADIQPDFKDLVQRMADGAFWAWTIISNANGGNWENVTGEWRTAAEKWRDEFFHPMLDETKGLFFEIEAE